MKSIHSTFSHGNSVRHASGVFVNQHDRQTAVDEFEKVMEDAMNEKKRDVAIAKRTEEKREKEKQLQEEVDALKEKNRLEAEALVEDTSHLMDEEIEDLNRAKRQQAAYDSVRKFFGRQLNRITKAFIDYGPPYNEENQIGGLNLVAQCANYPVRLLDLHMLLNERVNPNTKDPEDMHYTGMHWCARNFSVIAMKMLRRAGANIDIYNELHQTPLTLCVIVKQKKDRRSYQLRALKYLLDEGADVNTRDKAGYGPIDYAAKNQDMEICQILTNAGATIIRTNIDLVIPREPTLDLITDPDTYRVVLEKYEQEMEVIEKNEAIDLAKRVANAEKARIRKLHRDLAKKRDNRLASVRVKEEAKKLQDRLDQRATKLASDTAKEKAQHAERLLKFGQWKKEVDGGWAWEQKKPNEVKTFGKLYDRAQQQMQMIRDENCFQKFDGRWNAMTGKHLEIAWARGDAFIVEGIDNEKTVFGDPLNDETHIDEINDKELEGEDLDDLIGSLTTPSKVN